MGTISIFPPRLFLTAYQSPWRIGLVTQRRYTVTHLRHLLTPSRRRQRPGQTDSQRQPLVQVYSRYLIVRIVLQRTTTGPAPLGTFTLGVVLFRGQPAGSDPAYSRSSSSPASSHLAPVHEVAAAWPELLIMAKGVKAHCTGCTGHISSVL